MSRSLNEVERRVLGVLLEKALAQPQYYPMTVNAIVQACNQKSNRDPIMTVDEDAVWNTLEVLRAAEIVTRLLPGGASRVERFKHAAQEQFGWEKPQRAIMTELLLRGPQTTGELRTRCTRMYPFENTESVQAVLDSLSAGDEPWVAPLPRTAGRSAVRYAHRLYTDGEWARIAQSETATPAAAQAAPTAVGAPAASDRLGQLEQEVANLRAAIDALEQRLGALEERRAASS